MNKYKAILVFCLIISIFSYFILRSKNVTLASLSDFKINFKLTNIMENNVQDITEGGKIIITEKELNTMLKPYAKTIQNFNVNITPTNVTITGETIFPIKLPIDVVLLLKTSDGKLSYEVERMNLGSIPAPATIANKVIEGANKELENRINQKITVEKVEQDEEKIIIYGKTK